MTTYTDRAGNVLDHDPMACPPWCYQTHDVPGPQAPPYTGWSLVLAETATLPPADWHFKRHPRFLQIAEHTTPAQAAATLHCAMAEFSQEWPQISARLPELLLANDSLGDPYLFDVEGYLCSPVNFRYLYHAVLVLGRLRDLGYHPEQVHLIEIGGGYGGLALYVQTLAPIFGQAPKSYTIVDLPEAVAIQRRYGHHLNVPLRALDGTNPFLLPTATLPLDSRPRFLISAYAFAEFAPSVQQSYEPLIAQCDHGFLAWNQADAWPHRGANPVYPFTSKPLTVEPERPSAIGSSNYFVWF